MDLGKVALIAIGVMLIGSLVILLAEFVFSTSVYVEGTVVERSYTPSTTGVGTGVSGSGKVTTVVTTHSEKWAVVVTLDNGETVGAQTTAERWATVKPGDTVKVRIEIGAIFGWVTGIFVDLLSNFDVKSDHHDNYFQNRLTLT